MRLQKKLDKIDKLVGNPLCYLGTLLSNLEI